MRVAIAAGTVLLTLAAPAAAQPGAQPGTPVASPVERPKSEGAALALSVGGTLVSGGILLAGLAITSEELSLVGVGGAVTLPSLGHWYAGAYFTRGMALRLSGLAVFTIGGILWIVDNPKDEPEVDRSLWPGVILTAGAAAFIAGTIDDIITAPLRVQRRNEERGLAITPIVSGGSAGLAIGGRF